MKIKTILEILIILLFCLVDATNAQQGEDNPVANAQSPMDSYSYMGGKEQYLPDSPYYMAGKKQYLPNHSFSESGTTTGKNDRSPVSSEEVTVGEIEKSENQEGNQTLVEIIVIPGGGINDYGIIISPPLVRPEHHKGAISPPRIKGNFNPGVTGPFHHPSEGSLHQFHQDMRDFR